MNYRLLLLDYYHEYLKEQGVTQASFCYLDRKYKNQLSKFFYNEEFINIFHVKAPRVFNKSYQYKENIDSILDFILEVKQDFTLKYDNIDNQTKDVYYLKPLRNIDFKYLHIKYVDIDESYTGVMFLYSINESITLQSKDINRIFKQVIDSEELTIKNDLNSLIVENTNNYLIKSNNSFYISDSIKELLNLTSNFYTVDMKKYHHAVKQIESYIKTSKSICETKLVDKVITFYENKNHNNEVSIKSLKDILTNPPVDHFTIIYFESESVEGFNFLNDTNIIKEELAKNFIDNYSLYDLNDGMLVIINSLIELATLEKIKIAVMKKISQVRCLYLNTAYHFNKNTDLNILIEYLRENEQYSKESFKEYAKKQFEAAFLSDYNIVEKHIFNSYDSTLLGKYLGYNHLDLNVNQKKNYFLNSSKEIIDKVISEENDSIFIRLTYKAFNTKKIWYQLNKIKAKDKVIILSEIEVTSKQELDRLIQVIHHLHDIDFQIYFDSSVFSKLMLSDLINLYEGIFVEEYEMSLGYSSDDNLFQNIIVFYIKQNKKIILNKENIQDFEHPKIYYIK